MGATEDFVPNFCNALLSQLDGYLERFAIALRVKDYDTISYECHSIFPNFRLLGLYDFCTLIEDYPNINVDDSEEVGNFLERIDEYARMVKTTIEDYLYN